MVLGSACSQDPSSTSAPALGCAVVFCRLLLLGGLCRAGLDLHGSGTSAADPLLHIFRAISKSLLPISLLASHFLHHPMQPRGVDFPVQWSSPG